MFSVKDIRKLVVVSIIGACAVFVANLFLNFYLDIEQLEIFSISEELAFVVVF